MKSVFVSIKSSLIALGVVTLLFAINSISVLAYPSSWSLDVVERTQAKDNWCWAATVQSGLAYFGNTGIVQCDIVKAGKGTSTCDDVTGTIYDQLRAYNHWGVSGKGIVSSLSFDTIMSETYSNKRPLHAGWYWNQGGGHDVLVDGYDTTYGQYVSYMDPGFGSHYLSSYTWFKGGSGSGSDHVWGDSIYQLSD